MRACDCAHAVVKTDCVSDAMQGSLAFDLSPEGVLDCGDVRFELR